MKTIIVLLLLSLVGCTYVVDVEDPMSRLPRRLAYAPTLDYDTVHDAGGTFNPDGFGAPPGNPDATIQDIINAITHNGHVLDPNSVQAIGNAVILNAPSRMTGAGVPLNPGEGANKDVAATTVLEAIAKNQDSPQNLLVTINPPAVLNNGLFWPDLKARIFWGTGGTLATADVDCFNGTQVTVQGNYVRVDGLYMGLSPGAAPFPQVTLGASIGYGTRSSSATPPVWTRYELALVLAGATNTFIMPAFAKDVRIYAQQGGGGGVSAPIQIGFGPTGGEIIRIAQAADDTPTRVIPGGAQIFYMTNNNAFAVLVAAVFGLSL